MSDKVSYQFSHLAYFSEQLIVCTIANSSSRQAVFIKLQINSIELINPANNNLIGSGQAVLYSSLADQVSWEFKQYENSVFTHRLVEGLKPHGDKTALTEAYAHMNSAIEFEVLRDRGEMQTPVLNMMTWTGADPVLSVSPSSPSPGMTAATSYPALFFDS